MTEPIEREELLQRLCRMAAEVPLGQRRIVAIVGAPASGKSTLAQSAVDRVNATDPAAAALLPMDGFHLDDEVLVAWGWRARKGAPHTFDVGGLAAALRRLARNEEAWVAVPRFDRELEIARAGAILIDRAVRLVVVEGNYLLLDQAPWAALGAHFDVTAMLDVAEDALADRLHRRWVRHGYEPDAIRAKLQDNDLPNARLVRERSRPADWTIVG